MIDQDGPYHRLLDSLYEGLYFVDTERRITFWNRAAEELTGYRAEEVLGLRCADGLLVHVDGEGRSLCLGGCPLHQVLADGVSREADVFLKHKDGHRVPVRIRVSPVRDFEGALQGAVELFSDNSALLELLQRLRQVEAEATIEPLTGLPNRRYLEQSLDTHLVGLDRYGWGLGLLMLDIDHFKRINDVHGHPAGDQVLRTIARTLEHNLRSNDIPGRWGGEEFLVLLPAVEAETLRAAAERLRAMVAQTLTAWGDVTLRVTASIGGTLARPEDTQATLVARVDRALYRAKQAGRDRVEVEGA